jgi:hypothetical protein
MKTSDVLSTSAKHQVALSDKKRRVLMGASFGLSSTATNSIISGSQQLEAVFDAEQINCPFKSDFLLLLRQVFGKTFQTIAQIFDNRKYNRVFLYFIFQPVELCFCPAYK